MCHIAGRCSLRGKMCHIAGHCSLREEDVPYSRTLFFKTLFLKERKR